VCNAAGKPHANQTTGRLIQVTVKAADRDPQINTTLVDPKGATVAVWNDNNQPSLSPISDSDAAYTASVGTASVAFTLDGFGRMRVTTLKGQSQTITADYDTLGRQTELDDPDKGHWYYTNSALGHVLYQKDAKSNETTSAFDRLGRPLNRTTTGNGSTETANFYYYDTADNPAFHTVAKGEKGWIGAPQREECTATGSYPTTNLHYYDGKGRPSLELAQSDGKWFYTYSDYDAYSRVHQVRHYWKPAGVEAPGTQPYVWQDYGYIYAYDNRSYLLSLTDSQGRSWWDSPVYDYMDRVTSVRKGSDLTTVRTYRPTDGVLTGITTGSIQNLSFDYDGLGNLTSRSDALVTGGESLIYDNLNRLKTSKQGTTIYADNGNIMNKPDVAGAASDSYTYDSVHPHAVASAFGYAMTYDPNGNLLTRTKTGDNSYVKWAGFDKPRWLFRVTEVGTSGPLVRGSEFHYNAARSRVIQLEFDSVAGTVPNQVPQHYNRKRLYALGSTLELNYENRNTDKSSAGQDWTLDTVRIYVPGPDGLIGAREFRPGAAADSQEKPLVYHYDHLGTITAITTAFPPPAASVATDTTGKPGRFSEDAWGQRRNPFTWTGAPVTTGPNASDDGGADSLTPRGYTGHEMLDDLGLVHMNGRIYDPLLGRFLSADIVVQDPEDLQSYNRYSYVFNNPLSFTDPSGFVVWQPTETTLTEEQKKKMTAEQIAKVAAGNAEIRAYNKFIADAKALPGGAALFKYLDGRKETFMYGNAASFKASTSSVGELAVTQIDSGKIANRQISEVASWAVPTFKGFENSRFQMHDSKIMQVAIDFHFDPGKYSGGGNNLPSDISPALMKAWLLQESGGSDARSLAAWPIDPGQVNVPGDWGAFKSDVGLTRPVRRNTGTADKNITAAAMWLTRKGYGVTARPLQNNPTGTFDGWQTALQRYNGRSDVTSNGQTYSVNYAQLIVDRAQNPAVNKSLTLP